MKILLLSHFFYPDIGGIEINSEILADAFHKAGHEIRLLTWTEDPGEKPFPYLILRNPGFSALLRAHQWADVIFENNPCLRLAWPTLFFKKPHVVALCTWISRSDGKIAWQDKLKTWWLQKASSVIAVSEIVRKRCLASSIVISNPFRNELFRILPGVKKTTQFVFLGRLVSDKGADIAIKALSELLKPGPGIEQHGPGFSLTIIGDGPDLAMLKSLASGLGLQDQVDFTGSLKGEALVHCLNKHRFMLVPSVWEEPFGNVALEGMACGCVPIVSDGGGLVNAVGDAGISFSRGKVESLVDCIRMVINHPALEKKLRDAAPGHLAAHHPDKISGQYLAVFEKAVCSKPDSYLLADIS